MGGPGSEAVLHASEGVPAQRLRRVVSWRGECRDAPGNYLPLIGLSMEYRIWSIGLRLRLCEVHRQLICVPYLVSVCNTEYGVLD